MAEIKNLSQIRDKWARVTPQRTEDYKLGVQNPRRDWATAAKTQENTWKQAITDAATRGAYGAGVDKAGTQKWRERSLQKGPSRFAEGVMVGAADYAEGFEPYRQVIEQTELPPKLPTGDPRNIERVKAIAMALRAKKVKG
ncbi:MAG TPA: hypothetical protein EYP19_08425 [Desulfobacterales bacterium]|nr:hypothetical protein [Desulfobacterales bacterium]